MLRVVVDPNVFVSAVIQPAGVSAEVVRRRSGPTPHQMRLRRSFDAIVGTAEEHDDPALGARQLRDRGDEYLVVVALASGGDAIVSGDRDLLDGAIALAVVTPRELFDRLQSVDDG